MKILITVLLAVTFLSATAQKITIKSITGVSGVIDYSKNPAPLTLSIPVAGLRLDKVDNTSDKDKPVSNATQNLLYGKANKISVDSIKRDVTGLKEYQKILQDSIAYLNKKFTLFSSLAVKKDTVLISRKDTVLLSRKDTVLMSQTDSRYDSLFNQFTLLKSTIKEFNFSFFNGRGDSTDPVLNVPLYVTYQTRMLMKAKPGMQVSQVDGENPGTYAFSLRLNDWVLLY